MKELNLSTTFLYKNKVIIDFINFHNCCLFTEDYYSFYKYKMTEDYVYTKSSISKKWNVHSSIIRKKQSNYYKYFVNLICRNGNRLRADRMLKWAFSRFFELFLLFSGTKFERNFEKNFVYFNILKSYIGSLVNFFNINFFLNLMLPLFESIFTVNIVKPRKSKKKSKKDFSKDILYIKKGKRIITLIRFLYFYTNSFDRYSMRERLFCVLVNTFLGVRNSVLYKRKLYLYNKIMSAGTFR